MRHVRQAQQSEAQYIFDRAGERGGEGQEGGCLSLSLLDFTRLWAVLMVMGTSEIFHHSPLQLN